jgi:hypothetical protein
LLHSSLLLRLERREFILRSSVVRQAMLPLKLLLPIADTCHLCLHVMPLLISGVCGWQQHDRQNSQELYKKRCKSTS